jgi:hypothetical protein
MKLLIMQPSPASRHFLPLRSKFSSANKSIKRKLRLRVKPGLEDNTIRNWQENNEIVAMGLKAIKIPLWVLISV